MIVLTDGMLLYHASYKEIQSISLLFCKKGLDFGQSFYTTSSYQQAYGYVQQAVKNTIFKCAQMKHLYALKMDESMCIASTETRIFLSIALQTRTSTIFILFRPIETTVCFQNCFASWILPMWPEER